MRKVVIAFLGISLMAGAAFAEQPPVISIKKKPVVATKSEKIKLKKPVAKELAALQSQLEDLQKQYSSLHSQYESDVKECKSKAVDVEKTDIYLQLKQNFDKVSADFELYKKTSTTVDNVKLFEEIKRLQTELVSQNNMTASMVKRTAAAESENQQLKSSVLALEAKNQEYVKSVALLDVKEKELIRLKAQVVAKQQEIDDLITPKVTIPMANESLMKTVDIAGRKVNLTGIGVVTIAAEKSFAIIKTSSQLVQHMDDMLSKVQHTKTERNGNAYYMIERSLLRLPI